VPIDLRDPPDVVEELSADERAARLEDQQALIAVPDIVLTKAGPLTGEEPALIREGGGGGPGVQAQAGSRSRR